MERKIGEVFIDGERKLKVVKANECCGCIYENPISCLKEIEVTGLCSSLMRRDKISVIFKIEK